MYRNYLFIALFISTQMANAQSGVIEFNRKENWINILTKMPFLSQEEKEREILTSSKWQNEYKGEPYIYTFSEKGSTYLVKETDDNHGFQWKRDNEVFIRDFEQSKTNDIRFLSGKKYLIEEDIPRIKWKMLNEMKEVAGYVCMKAETRDTVNNIVVHAWYTDKIQQNGGPEGYGGLPGMILGLDFNNDDVLIYATKVDLKSEAIDLPVPKKMKGKKISYTTFNSLKKKFIRQSIEGKRNPYWNIRY
ncbi:MAG TPA: GLPGLI family protein [Saprospiraceae bacterium]|nr:GLPGLI family protein [Saprospiraceae bacterium]